jgi:2-C-methyl-D-erythritol 4-phosphate cytidylyltransferase/2-C-methyl-D-erythritol 2,4-cyclodiphosphate synthase
VGGVTGRPFVSAILAAGGLGTRAGGGVPKQFRVLGGQTLLERSLSALARHPRIDEVVVALPDAHLDPLPACLVTAWPVPVRAVAGGQRRRDSVARAFAQVAAAADVVLVHDAARPFVSAGLIDRMIDAVRDGGAAVPAVRAHDTVKRGVARDGAVWASGTLARDEIFLVQTPQAFGRAVLAEAFARAGDDDATDEAGLVERAGGAVELVEGEVANVKITTAEDLRRDAGPGSAYRVGTGYDLHRLVAGRRLVLAGVVVPFELGLDGHSDADIVCHAVTDAVLGAAALGDIGRLFPDTDAAWKDADSLALLRDAVGRVHAAGYRIGNVDVTIVAQRPKLLPYLGAMRASLAGALAVAVDAVSIKGKTNEGMDSTGRGESMACHAVAFIVGADGASEPRAQSPEPRR